MQAMHNVFVRNFLIFTAILLGCVLLLGFLLISGERHIEKSDDWVNFTHTVIIKSEKLNTLIAGMVASQRGYLISEDEEFAEDYQNKKAEASKLFATLRELTANDESQQSLLEQMQEYFVNLSNFLETTMDEMPQQGTMQQLRDVESINRIQENIIRLHNDFLEEEYGLLNKRIRIVESRKNQYFITLLIGGAVAVALLMIFNGYLLRVQTKRSAAEDELTEKKEIFRLAVEGTHDGVYDWNLKTGEIFYSDQYIQMLGYDREDFKGTVDDFSSRLHPDEKDEVWEYVNLFMDGQLSEFSNIFRMKHKSGRWVWVHSRGQLLRNKNDEAYRMVGAHTDVSAAKEYEARLHEAKQKAEEANRAKSDFLAHMSHEIRTPLTTISGVAEILQKDSDTLDKKKKKLVSVLQSSSVTLKDLISDVLDFSKIESGELELDNTAYDVSEIFQQIISVLAVKANEKKLDFKFSYKPLKGATLYGDPVRLRQVLINLIGNAIKFTEKGHVHVTARREEFEGVEILKIDVEDTGIGIAESQMDVVFEQFKQADSSVSKKFGGTGLGLPISKRLAELMGGSIKVTSEQGKGSTFTLIVPLQEVEQDDQTVVANENIEKLNKKLKSIVSGDNKILLVEDYEGNVVVLSYILESIGLSFDHAKTGLEALNKWKENHYSMILMDIQMPEMDGFTATKHIRQIEEEQGLDKTPIIGMTAHALVGDRDKCIECGMDAYLPKPIVEADLKGKILEFLKQQKKAA